MVDCYFGRLLFGYFSLVKVEVSLALVETILAMVDIIIVYSLLVDNSSSTQKAANSRNCRL